VGHCEGFYGAIFGGDFLAVCEEVSNLVSNGFGLAVIVFPVVVPVLLDAVHEVLCWRAFRVIMSWWSWWVERSSMVRRPGTMWNLSRASWRM